MSSLFMTMLLMVLMATSKGKMIKVIQLVYQVSKNIIRVIMLWHVKLLSLAHTFFNRQTDGHQMTPTARYGASLYILSFSSFSFHMCPLIYIFKKILRAEQSELFKPKKKSEAQN